MEAELRFPCRAACVAGWFAVAGACSAVTAPTQPAPPPVPGIFSLSGVVSTPPDVALSGATVEIADTPSGRRSVQSGPDGRFAISVFAGDLRVRATKEGYDPVVREVSMTADQIVNFELMAATAQPDLSGTYQLTIVAATNCKLSYFGSAPLPVGARRRTYVASITQKDAQVTVELAGAEFVRYPPPSTAHVDAAFSGHVLGQTITFQIPGNPEDGYPWVERIAPTTYLGIGGTLVATVTGRDIEGDLDGIISTFDDRDSLTGNCESGAHSVVFERTSPAARHVGRGQ